MLIAVQPASLSNARGNAAVMQRNWKNYELIFEYKYFLT
jgi:hypothetical protein